MNRKQPTEKTTLLLLSDTHTLTPQPPTTTSSSPSSSSHSHDHESSTPPPAFLDPLPAADILIHAGDLTKVSRRHEHLTTLSYLKAHPARLKLVIPGNHDITFDAPYYESLGHHRHRNRTDHTAPSATASAANISSGKAEPGHVEDPDAIRRLYTGPEAWDAGIRLLGEGVHEFEVPGPDGKKTRRLTVYASSWTPEFCQWAFGYERGVDRFNPPASASASSASSSSPGTAEGRRKEEEDGDGVDGNPAIGTRTEEHHHHHHHHHTHGHAHNHHHQEPQPNESTAAATRERPRTHGSTGSRGEGARGAIAANSGRGGFVAPAPIPDGQAIDIVITHGPPYGILDHVGPDHVSVGCEHLYRAVRRARPRLHVFGHIHEGYGAMRREWSTGNDSIIQCDQPRTREEHCARVDVSRASMMPLNPGQETLFVNASVVNVQYHPINAPWLVEMELPVVVGEGN
ncbi:hypothetical protein BP00DRAFT_421451 [Aspergillus indologenus CBS 114.80]|uniref:Uncharacterized protein n=1 Tax=Aspergillus indologenus CBS 114.80 TaxID=1450541 RepID=A0A2V5III7_9EURO|nr:hypothetical protein BP00DRAFT_421451 [Aspergillus indologenus CBS 114.80]